MVYFDFSTSACEKKCEEHFDQLLTISQKGSFYLLLSSMSISEDTLLGEMLKNKTQYPLVISHASIRSKFYPCLYQLDLALEADRELLKLSLKESLNGLSPDYRLDGNICNISAWIVSTFSAEVLASQLAMLMIQKNQNDDIWLRIMDPAVFLGLFHLLLEVQQQKLLNPVLFWCVLDGDAQLIIKENKLNIRKNHSQSLGLLPAQWLKIEQMGAIHLALLNYRHIQPNDNRYDEHTSRQLISQALVVADDYQITHKNDVMQICSLALIKSLNVVKHPYLEKLLLQCKKDQTVRFSELVSKVTDDKWHEIESFLQQHNEKEKSNGIM